MSKATELAEAEAARAESDPPDDETNEPTETNPPTEPPTPPGEPETDEDPETHDAPEHGELGEPAGAAAAPPASLTISDELNEKREAQAKSQARNVERLADEYGQDVTECPVCGNVDLAALILARMHGIPAEGWAMLGASVGAEPAPPRKMAEGVITCEHCNGYGTLDYPTLNPHMKEQNCPACASAGYVPEPQEQAATVATLPLPSIPATAPAWAPPTSGPDAWGRPQGHPHYGLDPAAVMP